MLYKQNINFNILFSGVGQKTFCGEVSMFWIENVSWDHVWCIIYSVSNLLRQVMYWEVLCGYQFYISAFICFTLLRNDLWAVIKAGGGGGVGNHPIYHSCSCFLTLPIAELFCKSSLSLCSLTAILEPSLSPCYEYVILMCKIFMQFLSAVC